MTRKHTSLSHTVARYASILFIFLLLSSCGKPDARLREADGTRIAYTFYEPAVTTTKAVILLHELGKDRHVWDELAPELAEHYAVISIDLRGHGESSGDYERFTPQDYQNMYKDAGTAQEFLRQKGYTDFGAIGASIGANVALVYASAYDAKAAVLLSPGMNIQSINLQAMAPKVREPILLIASVDDGYSAESVDLLQSILPRGTKKRYDNAGHGTEMLQNKQVKDDMLAWFAVHIDR